jgi:hypothetical protein
MIEIKNGKYTYFKGNISNLSIYTNKNGENKFSFKNR